MGNDATVKFGYDGRELNSGLKSQETGINSFASRLEDRFKKMGSLMKGYLTFQGIKGVGNFLMGQLNAADDLLDLSTKLGASAESIQRLEVIGKVGAGMDVESMVAALGKMQKVMAGVGEDQAASEAFADLGLEVENFIQLEPDRQLLALADAFQEAQAKGDGMKQVYDLFGKKAAELLPILAMDREELIKLSKTPVVSEENLLRLGSAADTVDTYKSAITNMVKEGVLSKTLTEEEQKELDKQVETRHKQQKAIREATAAKIADEQATGKLAKAQEKQDDSAKKEIENRKLSLTLLKQETSVLELKARGKDKAAAKEEKRMAVEARARQINQDTGISLADAFDMAQHDQDLKDKIAARENGEPVKIRGVQKKTMMNGGLDQFRALQQGDPNGYKYDAFERPNTSFYRKGRFLGGGDGGSLSKRSGDNNQAGTAGPPRGTSNSSQYTGISVEQASRMKANQSSSETLGFKLDQLIKVCAEGLLN